MLTPNIKISLHSLREQAYIITSEMVELYQEMDPYGPQFPDPIIISTVCETVAQLMDGNTADLMDNLEEIKQNEDDDDIMRSVTEITEDIKDFMDMYKEVHG